MAQQSQIGEEELGYRYSLSSRATSTVFQGRSLGICKKLAKQLSNASFSIWQLFLPVLIIWAP